MPTLRGRAPPSQESPRAARKPPRTPTTPVTRGPRKPRPNRRSPIPSGQPERRSPRSRQQRTIPPTNPPGRENIPRRRRRAGHKVPARSARSHAPGSAGSAPSTRPPASRRLTKTAMGRSQRPPTMSGRPGSRARTLSADTPSPSTSKGPPGPREATDGHPSRSPGLRSMPRGSTEQRIQRRSRSGTAGTRRKAPRDPAAGRSPAWYAGSRLRVPRSQRPRQAHRPSGRLAPSARAIFRRQPPPAQRPLHTATPPVADPSPRTSTRRQP